MKCRKVWVFIDESNLKHYGITEFTAFRGVVFTVKNGVSRMCCCIFCEVQLSLVSSTLKL